MVCQAIKKVLTRFRNDALIPREWVGGGWWGERFFEIVVDRGYRHGRLVAVEGWLGKQQGELT